MPHGVNTGIHSKITETLTPDQIQQRSLIARHNGKILFEQYVNNSPARKWVCKSNIHLYGGKENFISVFKAHYQKLFTDPFMNTLFDMSHKDTNISSDDHGTRLASFFLSHFGDYDDYYNLRKARSTLQHLNVVHTRAKGCPFRGNLKNK